jgi:hypothetical protein
LAPFDFVPEDDDIQTALEGTGEAANGQIRATVGEDGRLRELTISPGLLRHTRGGGTFLDSDVLAAEIAHAVNAAMDDLIRRTAIAAAPSVADLSAELSTVRTDLDRALNDARTELERAERRIAGR